ncbi:MAG: protein-export chaperone SecB [Betaproteobacteria bacterium]|jgi:preprotein translocase subunit SecB|nr:protein-export chaperone SecB [Pseudomonadota bacterium]NBO94874.1 protein-export chaperone SecB [Betaproteobacteria bacterium]NBP34397.1 protein-export chaperone SecB [Betaproteobacteria bacterium]NBP36922.1 protein-export chaperone SecB [Betaproteobacteria bacterium]NBQ77431.1 protein-export chaperone SecB [Betaproteobacteria bacterium]
MADEQQASAAQGEQAPQFSIQRIYLKDMSLELPHAPQIFLESSAPSVEIQLDITNELLGEGVHETAVRVTVTAKMADKVAFLIEATQAGIFTSQGIGGEQMEAVANILCPSIIYPYLRSNIADAVQRSGFPPVHLAEINFEALYQQRLAEQQAQAGASGNGSGIILPH